MRDYGFLSRWCTSDLDSDSTRKWPGFVVNFLDVLLSGFTTFRSLVDLLTSILPPPSPVSVIYGDNPDFRNSKCFVVSLLVIKMQHDTTNLGK